MSSLAELGVCVCVCRVDNMLKQLAEIRDQDRRLRALESEVSWKPLQRCLSRTCVCVCVC